MLVASWNVNSVRSRLERLLAWLAAHQPDVLCLQELKCTEEQFPFEPLLAAGYHCAVHGQKTYNGVAILSKGPAEDAVATFGDAVEDDHARILGATVQGLRIYSVYVPNGATVGSDKYEFKLRWLQRLQTFLKAQGRLEQPMLVCGDFNIAPEERDVKDPEGWSDTVLFHPQMRQRLAELLELGLADTFRLHHQEPGHYSWWDYRNLGFQKNDGLRIDLILATKKAAQRCTGASIDRAERKGKQPSDHAPVLATFDWP